MNPPLPCDAQKHLLKILPAEREDLFPRLANLSTDQLVDRRIEITEQLKILEQERHTIDAQLLDVYSDAELRLGLRAPGGWVLRQRNRTSWEYAPEIRDAIKGLQQQAQRDGRARQFRSTYLVATQEGN